MPERPRRGGAARLAQGLLLLLAPALAAAAGGPVEDPVEAVSSAFSAGQLGRAEELTAEIEDPLLRAEWRFHVLYHGGDLAGALGAAREGLRLDPDHPALLENGARCALALGLGERARERSEALVAVASDAAQRARAVELVEASRALVAREERAAAGLARARGVALALLGLACVLLALLARAPGAGGAGSRA